MKRHRDVDESDDNGAKRTGLPVNAKSDQVSLIHEKDACPFRFAPPEPEVIDSDGDLHLTVGKIKCTGSATQEPHEHKSAVTFLVDSRAMIRASLTWKHILRKDQSGRSENDIVDGSEWHVYFPDDSPYAMRAILNAIHGRFKRLDTVKNVYLVTVLSEKYDLAEVLRPWTACWTSRWETSPCSSSVFFNDKPAVDIRDSGLWERHIWIFWELGDKPRFYRAVNKVAQCSYRTASSRLSIKKASNQPGGLFSNSKEVPGVYGMYNFDGLHFTN
jgi:hypothetical protein